MRWLVVLVALAAGLTISYFSFRSGPARRSTANTMGSETGRREEKAEVPRAFESNSLQAPGAIATSASKESPSEVTTKNSGPAQASPPPSSSPAILPEVELTSLPPATVVENVRTVFREFQSRFGANPVGTNPEITRALKGDNPRQVDFLNPEDGLRVNAKGELVDSWGTPFFFHQLSAREMEIRSAGPDRVLWTEDDLVTR